VHFCEAGESITFGEVPRKERAETLDLSILKRGNQLTGGYKGREDFLLREEQKRSRSSGKKKGKKKGGVLRRWKGLLP